MKKARICIAGLDAIKWFRNNGHETLVEFVSQSAGICKKLGVSKPVDSKEIVFVFIGLDDRVKITGAFFYDEREITSLLADTMSQYSLSHGAIDKIAQFDLVIEE